MDMMSIANQAAEWIPIRIFWSSDAPVVDWCWIGKRRLSEPFFDHTIDECFRLPFSALFRPQTSIDLLREQYESSPGLPPRGLIFHMSRCGSTLVSQMLAALPSTVVISEAGPIDSVLRAHLRESPIDDERQIDWLRWLVSAIGQPRNGDETRLFIKFDCWNTLALPLIQRAFPDVPWVFIYRNPIEVLVSQWSQRGAHMVPGAVEPELFAMDLAGAFQMPPEEYCARVLAQTCEAALIHNRDHSGILINYEQLPDAVWTDIAGHFGIEFSSSDKEAANRVTLLNAKNPSLTFQPDSHSKRDSASESLRQASEQWLVPIYDRLEAARLGRANCH
jgi:hypothetical protein